jgi:hypothetical protein
MWNSFWKTAIFPALMTEKLRLEHVKSFMLYWASCIPCDTIIPDEEIFKILKILNTAYFSPDL